MFEALRQHLNRLSARQKLAVGNGDDDKANRAIKFFARITRKLVDAERSSIFILDPAKEKIWLKAGTGVGEHDIEVSPDDSIVGQVIGTGAPVVLAGLEHQEGAHKATDAVTGFTTRSIICVPICDPDLHETVGAIQALNKQGKDGFDEQDAALLSELAEQVQARVSRIFLDQEIYGLSEKVLNASKRVVGTLLITVAALVGALILVLSLWLLVPMFS